jgi:Ser/Thr protein kinase RdoA (MazF antagonist)
METRRARRPYSAVVASHAVRPSETLPTLDASLAWSLVGEGVEHVEAIGDGTRSRVYRVHLAEGGTRIVRLSPKAAGRVAREAWVRARMAGCAAVPVVHASPAPRTSLDVSADVVLMNDLPGTSMARALVGASETLAAGLWCAFGEGVAAFHAVPVEGFGLLDAQGRGASPSWRAVMEPVAAEALRVARASPLIDLCDRAEAALAEAAPALDRVTAPRLIHGDAQPGNVQVHRERVTAFFDFEFAMGADPLYELAFVGRFFEPAPWAAPDARARLQAMEAFTRGYSARFAPLGDDPERCRYYRVAHALRMGELFHDGRGDADAVAAVRAHLERALSRN